MADGVTVTTHYPKSDKQMYGDYYTVSIRVTRGKMTYAMEYGDHYHDKGQAKAEGFVDALKILFGSKFPVIRHRVADQEDY